MNNTDPTSFQSILAGASRLRREAEGEGSPKKKSNRIEETRQEKPQFISALNAPATSKPVENLQDSGAKPPEIRGGTGRTVLVNKTQRENPLLNHLRNTSWRYSNPAPGDKVFYDYLIRARSVLFLTLTYHRLYPDYLERRMQPLQKGNDGILLFIIDDSNSEEPIAEITKRCMFGGFTLLLAFNFEQAARYIEFLNS